jgi:hypothetical protein
MMTPPLTIGDIRAIPGSIQYGRFEALTHPTGHTEFFPIVLAKGAEEGPCLWLTAGIHGPEQAGPSVLYRLITTELVSQLRGTIVAIPALNPAGLRTMKRKPYHAQMDPNRLWPDGKSKALPDPDKDPPTSLELAYGRLFEQVLVTANAMIDYHNAWTGSLSFSFLDRMFYRADRDADQNKAEAEALSSRQMELLRAYGHTIICEMPGDKLIDDDLHRSTTAAALYLGKIPSFTVELGTGHMPDPAIVAAACSGTRNVMRLLGMLIGEYEPIDGIKVVDFGSLCRRLSTPRVSEACIVLHRVEAGDTVRQGDIVADVLDVWGRPLGEGVIRSEYDGFVLGREHGIYYYPGESILSMAVPNTTPVVIPYPADYFKEKSH